MNLPDHIRELFLDEFEELCSALETGLGEMEEAGGSATTISDLFRSAHSLKGAAQVAGVRPLTTVAHAMETVLSALRDGTLGAHQEVGEALLASVDWLRDAAAALRADDEPDRQSARGLADRLTTLASTGEAALPGPMPPKAAAFPPFVEAPAAETLPDAATIRARAREAVRVPVAKLDRLVGYATELMSARHDIDTLRGELAAAGDAVAGQEVNLARLRSVLRTRARDGLLPPDVTAALEDAATGWRNVQSALRPLAGRAAAIEREVRQAAAPLAESALQLRMVPFRQIFEGLERLVRDAGHAAGKQVALTVIDGAVEVDRSVALALHEPLIHLVNNAIDHGIEYPAERAAAGKTETGRIRITAELRGGRVAVSVIDDGAGLRSAAVRAAAVRAGFAATEDFADVVTAVFTPGVTTAPTVTQTSGRGVGLDAVRARVEGLGGSVALESAEGSGTSVTLVVPLTLSIVHAVVVGVGEQVLALVSSGIQRVVRVAPEQVQTIGGWPSLMHAGAHVPLMDLGHVLGLPSATLPPDVALAGLLVESGGAAVVLTVSTLTGEQDVTVQDLGLRLEDAPATLGTALLAEGRIAPVLSATACARLAVEGTPSPTLRRGPIRAEERIRPRILLAEDTLTTRALEQGILEAAGYDVTTAVDGADAWEKLRAHGADLVVSDVNMPRMDGFELCTAIRQSRRFGDVPVVLVTSLAEESDRRRGVEVGASAYITKSGFDQGWLVQTVDRLLR